MLHFHYLLEENGGFLRVARSMDEHLEQLDAGLRGGVDRERMLEFTLLVRPSGRPRPACRPARREGDPGPGGAGPGSRPDRRPGTGCSGSRCSRSRPGMVRSRRSCSWCRGCAAGARPRSTWRSRPARAARSRRRESASRDGRARRGCTNRSRNRSIASRSRSVSASASRSWSTCSSKIRRGTDTPAALRHEGSGKWASPCVSNSAARIVSTGRRWIRASTIALASISDHDRRVVDRVEVEVLLLAGHRDLGVALAGRRRRRDQPGRPAPSESSVAGVRPDEDAEVAEAACAERGDPVAHEAFLPRRLGDVRRRAHIQDDGRPGSSPTASANAERVELGRRSNHWSNN